MKADSPVLILAALEEELKPLYKICGLKRPFPCKSGDFQKGKFKETNIVLGITGVGPEIAEKAVRDILKLVNPVISIQIGYAGALNDTLFMGDLILADAYLDYNAENRSILPEPAVYKLYRNNLIANDFPFKEGGTITVSETLACDTMRSHFGSLALAVQMEDYSVAALMASHGIPHLVTRIISDNADSTLGDILKGYPEGGPFRKIRVGIHFMLHPVKALKIRKMIKVFPRLSKVLAKVIIASIGVLHSSAIALREQ